MNINQISSVIAIIVSILYFFYRRWKKENFELTDIVISIMAGGMLPLSFSFVIYPFCPYLINIKEMGLQITLTGIVLIYVYIKTIVERFMNSS